MRIPFDLLAALLALESILELLRQQYNELLGNDYSLVNVLAADQEQTTTLQASMALLGFWLIVWLMHELLARRAEWRTRWGLWPQGLRIVSRPEGPAYEPTRWHPMEAHARQAVLAQFLAVGLYAYFIYYFGWPIKTQAWPSWLGLDLLFSETICNALSDSHFINGLLGLGPFAVAMVIALIPKHRLLAMETGRRESLMSWLSFELRLTFPPLILWLALYAFFDLATLLVPDKALTFLNDHPWLIVLLGGLVLAGFAMALMPWMMIRLWHARPMVDRETHERLTALLKRSGVRARAILEWGPAGTGFANACVLGPWTPFRYILISPALMRLLSPDECEAVIAHEIGHVRHKHLGLLVFVVLGLAAWSDLILRELEGYGYGDPVTQGVVLMALIVVYLRLLFGVISRRCERQADLSAAELIGSPSSLISALEKLALLSGGTRDVYSWHHDSIARRVLRLETDGRDPEAIRRYHKSQRSMRLGLISFSAVAIGLLLFFALTDVAPSGKNPAEGTSPNSVQKTTGLSRSPCRSDAPAPM